MRGVLGAFSGFAPGEQALTQMVLRPARCDWGNRYMHMAMSAPERLKVQSPVARGGQHVALTR
jgi:hypothetical protein